MLSLLPTTTPTAAQEVLQDRTEVSGPNRTMLHTGIWTLGLSYVPALVVATESTRIGDKYLYIPVTGPWMDLAARSPCAANMRCSNETTNKVLLVVDGVFQGIGALDLIGAFLLPETRVVTTRAQSDTATRGTRLSLRLSPTRFQNNGYGLAAHGTF
jgi:hypothetical protein